MHKRLDQELLRCSICTLSKQTIKKNKAQSLSSHLDCVLYLPSFLRSFLPSLHHSIHASFFSFHKHLSSTVPTTMQGNTFTSSKLAYVYSLKNKRQGRLGKSNRLWQGPVPTFHLIHTFVPVFIFMNLSRAKVLFKNQVFIDMT